MSSTVRTVVAADTRFLVREEGSGDGVPVLLLHGVPETSTCWAGLLPQLAVGRRVLAPDLPGLGASSFSGPYDVPSLVTQLVALLAQQEAGVGRRHGADTDLARRLIGHWKNTLSTTDLARRVARR